MTGLTARFAGLGMKSVAVFLVVAIAAIDSPQTPGAFMAFILYSRMAIQTGDYIAVNRRPKRLDIYVAAASLAGWFMAINALFLGICPEMSGRKNDHQCDQVKRVILIAVQWTIFTFSHDAEHASLYFIGSPAVPLFDPQDNQVVRGSLIPFAKKNV